MAISATLAPIPPPPFKQGINAGILWASSVQAQAAVWAREGVELEKVRVVTGLVTSLGKLRHLALDSEDAVKVLHHYKGVQVDALSDIPPVNPLGQACWAWWQLAKLLYACLSNPVKPALVQQQSKALVTIGSVFPSAALEELTAELESEQEEVKCLPTAA